MKPYIPGDEIAKRILGLTIRVPRSIVKPLRVQKRIGRNEPCTCGSGKKHKHCCGAPEGNKRTPDGLERE